VSRALQEMGLGVEEANVCSVSSYCVDLVVRQAVPISGAGRVAARQDGGGTGQGGGGEEGCGAGSKGWLLLFEEEGERYFRPHGCHWAKGTTIVRRRHLERLFSSSSSASAASSSRGGGGGCGYSVVVVPSWEWHLQLARPGARGSYLRDKLLLP